MKKALLIFLILGSMDAFSQDEDLSALETAIEADITPTPQSPRSRSLPREKITDVLDPAASYQSRTLDLRMIIEEGLRRNPFQRIRENQKEQIELLRTDVWQEFWLPTVSLDLDVGKHRIDRFRRSTTQADFGAQQAPTGSLGLVIEDYTLFNWGRDYLAYQNAKGTLDRSNLRLVEEKRDLRFGLISQYFNLVRLKMIKNVYQEQLRQSSFVHRLAREKLQLRKIRAQEYYQTRSEYLRAQTEYQEALFNLTLQEEEIANLLGDEFVHYKTEEELKYVSLNLTMTEAIKLSLTQSEEYRDAKLQYEIAERAYTKTLKDNLPLPKFSFNLGTYRTGFDPDGTSWSYQTAPGSRDIELVAAIDMSWTLIGEGGLFNQRQNKQAFLNKRTAEISYFNVKRALEVKVRTIYKSIKFLEQKVEISTFQYKNAQKNYDSVLDNYIAGRASYADIKLAIDNLVLSRINAEDVKYQHLLKKLELADFMGVDDFPGENFEKLAQR